MDNNVIHQEFRKIEISGDWVFITVYYPNSNLILSMYRYKLEQAKPTCQSCGWVLADPDPCEGCKNQEFWTNKNHMNDNEV